MKRFDELVIFNGGAEFLTLPAVNSDVLENSTTPELTNAEVYMGSGVVVTVSYFLGGLEGRTYKIIGDGTTTIGYDITKIYTNTGANKLLVANRVYRFTLHNSIWYEDA